MSINGVINKFKFITKSSNDGFKSHFVYVWKNDTYEITTDTKLISTGDETFRSSGTLKLKRSDGQETIRNIYGKGGC
ncbi:hypothetical protein A3A03_01995 [Candidatus Nomurabacteria bacterium RIFCSPLOWO2_01_FULL_40_18]|uniref:Lipocalin-like domain-containing protein n=1 Tax=Candidatus Nomurabacteria bacterium RIFCSPLOWO2_01_FULL_40_18 TaxID=1801773 RepID=A0A1F6XIB8_9BACT|nr:MAG: hypothetical protein A3A03_01995 [Candidatus Nomurabacteria bacterium RIFCSPLOWO2_01_FULL_40_18]